MGGTSESSIHPACWLARSSVTGPACCSARHCGLTPVLEPKVSVSAYAVAWVRSPVARSAVLSVGSDDAVRAWWNGDLVISNDVRRGAAPGHDSKAVEVREGWNRVLLKIVQGA